MFLMSHHCEQKLHILSDKDLQTATQKTEIQTQIETGFAFFTDPKITAIVLWEFNC